MAVLLNWLAQGFVVALTAAVGLRLMRTAPARARHDFIWIAYLLVPALPLMALASPGATDVQAAAVPGGAVLTVPAGWWTSPMVAWGFLFAWAAVHGARLAAGAFAVRRARRLARPCPSALLAELPHWPRIAGGRSTPVVLSDRVRSAAVLGCGSPVIAVAPALLERLDAADLDRVLVHEWAHVQRRDDIAQILQRIVRAIAGWHPAAWWLERQLELEREAACDEIAVTATGSAKAYATCLTTLAALQHPAHRPIPAVAALSASSLEQRLVRILTSRHHPGAARRRLGIVFAVVALAAVAVTAGNICVVALDAVSETVRARPAAILTTEPPVFAVARPVDIPDGPVTPVPGAPLQSGGRVTLDVLPSVHPVERPIAETPAESAPALSRSVLASTPIATVGHVPIALIPAAPAFGMPQRVDQDVRAAWTIAAVAGTVIGRSSKTAGLATGGFFSRVGKQIARSF